MSNPKQEPWEQLTEDQREQVYAIFERAVDDAITDVAAELGLTGEHAEALFGEWVIVR